MVAIQPQLLRPHIVLLVAVGAAYEHPIGVACNAVSQVGIVEAVDEGSPAESSALVGIHGQDGRNDVLLVGVGVQVHDGKNDHLDGEYEVDEDDLQVGLVDVFVWLLRGSSCGEGDDQLRRIGC